MVRALGREAVGCASCFNWCSFVLLLFATISSYWSWGYTYPKQLNNVYGPATVSTGPWVAGWVWSTYAVPCNCANSVCYSWCSVGSYQLNWASLTAENVCNPTSTVYQQWSKPLGYCTFPPGYSEDSLPQLPSNATGYYGGSTPAGTVYNQPSQVQATQALSILAVITVFFAAIAGCADAGIDDSSLRIMGITACGCSFLAWVFILTAYCLWTTFPYVVALQGGTPASVWMPVWVNPSTNAISAVQTTNTLGYGPGWVTALTASILIIFAQLIHCASLKNIGDTDIFQAPPSQQQRANEKPSSEPIPAGMAVPVPPGMMGGGDDIANV